MESHAISLDQLEITTVDGNVYYSYLDYAYAGCAGIKQIHILETVYPKATTHKGDG